MLPEGQKEDKKEDIPRLFGSRIAVLILRGGWSGFKWCECIVGVESPACVLRAETVVRSIKRVRVLEQERA
jgi:hypothetical protein